MCVVPSQSMEGIDIAKQENEWNKCTLTQNTQNIHIHNLSLIQVYFSS